LYVRENFRFPKETVHAKNVSTSTPIPSLIVKSSFQASHFLSSTFNFAPPVPQFYTAQYRYGRTMYMEKSPFTRNDVENVAVTPMERINASAISSTTSLTPEGPDTARLENSMPNHVTKINNCSAASGFRSQCISIKHVSQMKQFQNLLFVSTRIISPKLNLETIDRPY
jgi:hypothetical protein